MRLELFSLLAATLSAIGCTDASSEAPDISPAEHTLIASGYQYLDPGEIPYELRGVPSDERGRVYIPTHADTYPDDVASVTDCPCERGFQWYSTWVAHDGAICLNGTCTPATILIVEGASGSLDCYCNSSYAALGSGGHAGHFTTRDHIDPDHIDSPDSTTTIPCNRWNTCGTPF